MMFIDIVKLSFVDCIIRDFTVSAFKNLHVHQSVSLLL